MPNPRPLDYHSPATLPPRRRFPFLHAALLAGLTLIIYGLYRVKNLPYRPPYDMDPVLGEREEEFVSGLIFVLAIPWIVSLWAVVRFFVSLSPSREN